ncbi:MAG: leucine--tRNA ligase [Spirochaetaceae bacterium]|jgi:leucyl-tRNA synthetase|nr:leucine--tRNA ligase [Spirochaetaceae bacterium]
MYPFSTIEPKWQEFWEKNKTFRAVEDPSVPKEKRRYVLDMFPYPSSQGLHVGHPEGYTATDIYCRYLRANGFNVLHPMGFDAFGLPAENYAIKTGRHPAATTAENIDRFRKQIKKLGFSYDWDREVDTSSEGYYRWTQWLFLQLYKKGLAYEADSPINWCPSCKTGLANEEVKDGECERCHSKVTRRRIRQWVLKITAYAERLLDDLDGLDWPEPVKLMQRNWIGKSCGAEVRFEIEGTDKSMVIYTTRPDTLFGVTYMVLAPEHPLALAITAPEQKPAVEKYIAKAAGKSDLERSALAKTKTGVFTGAHAVNPVNQRRVPVWIADYVLISYGTGAIMAVPAHDERDWEFAKTFGLPVIQVVSADGGNALAKSTAANGLGEAAAAGGSAKSAAANAPGENAAATTPVKSAAANAPVENAAEPAECTAANGYAVNSGQFSGLPTEEAQQKITQFLEEKGLGKRAVNYKLRDWIFSRQRYWGEPIPLVHCEHCGIVPLDEGSLPLRLPDVKSYVPTGTGESPLANITEWVHTTCPQCGGPARRETNTMPQWAGSCWYYLRYLDPHNTEAFASRAAIDYWAPVDLYVGGTEHAVLHLLYARFWHKVFYDLGLVNTSEPFIRLVNQGMILGEDNQKMSKSRGNVVNPDDIITEYGADAMRLYEMFMGPLEVSKPWMTAGLTGVSRFLDRLWNISEKYSVHEGGSLPPRSSPASGSSATPLSGGSTPATPPCTRTGTDTAIIKLLHKTIKKVTEDTATLNFNTAISAMMVYSAELARMDIPGADLWEPLVIMLAAYAPHLGEELWEKAGHAPSVSRAPWPVYDAALAADSEKTIVVQINGKNRDKFTAASGTGKAALEKTALSLPAIQKWLAAAPPKKIIVVPDKLVNIVV